MAYAYDLAVSLGSSKAGLSLTASVRDVAGSAISQPAYTIVDHGSGWYSYHTAAMPDGHRGVVRILDGSTVLALGVVTPVEVENADVRTSTRMATYAQPTGFLAATFPATLASTTNITAGTITTVGTLTNLPSAPTDWITAGSVSAAAVTKVQAGLATPTNITAGVLTTVGTATNLTNLPAVPADWLTAAGVKADAVAKIQSGLALASQVPANFTAATFASAGVFATDALANAPTGGGGGLDLAGLQGELTTRGLTSALATTITTNLDATITSRLAASAYAAPDLSGLATSSALATLSATVGAAGAGLTALGDARLANLDAPVSAAGGSSGGLTADQAAWLEYVYRWYARARAEVVTEKTTSRTVKEIRLYNDAGDAVLHTIPVVEHPDGNVAYGEADED